ncbi:DUF134 domain-containing protein [Dehalogenimonas sp. THU2]|uniref:DUF134 domain-containing protein n=1 Tax=Dehalogenimonas sp. THU2 TaxID=3151121 RepID=UPI0032184EFA
MTRPPKCRAVESMPGVTYYKPAGIPLRLIEELVLPVEGLEALRLKDLEGLDQAECAAKMGISRATFQRVLAKARKTVAEALTTGKAIKIEGGVFFLTDSQSI